MKKTLFLALAALTLAYTANSQITKGNWLLGGIVSFSSFKNSSTVGVQYKQTNVEISPTVGYFLKDKIAVGLRPSFNYGSNTVASSNTIISIGPFVRYYFLNTENIINLFTEGSYAYGTSRGKGQGPAKKLNTFSFSGGPVVYFNSSVGLEFIIAYSATKSVGFPGTNNQIGFGIGFQIHLDKDK